MTPTEASTTCPPREGGETVEVPASEVETSPTIPVEPESVTLPFRAAEDPVLCKIQGYGRGASLVDLDGDGWDDLFLADTDSRWSGNQFGVSHFLRNDEGRLSVWDLGVETDDLLMNGGGIFADYDDDGDPDLLLVAGNNTGDSRLVLYRNDLAATGGFSAVRDSGLSTAEEPWWGASWGDVDGDGDLDLVVNGLQPVLYLNDGDGTFTDVSDDRGIPDIEPSWGLQNPLLFDFTGDGAPDLFVAGLLRSMLLENDGTGHFRDVTVDTGLEKLTFSGVFSAATADFDQDGSLDLWLGRWWFQDLVLLNDGGGRFRAIGADAGIVTQVWDKSLSVLDDNLGSPDVAAENTMGLNTADLDRNGSPDVLIGTGDPTRARPVLAFCSTPDPATRVRFRRCSEPLRSGLGEGRHHGSAVGDIDLDGFDDLVANPGGFPWFDSNVDKDTRESPMLFRGTGEDADRQRIAHLRLRTGPGPRNAIGAKVRVEPTDGSATQHLWVHSAQGFQSQNSDRLTLLTGREAEVHITWPDGQVQQVTISGGDDVTIAQ